MQGCIQEEKLKKLISQKRVSVMVNCFFCYELNKVKLTDIVRIDGKIISIKGKSIHYVK